MRGHGESLRELGRAWASGTVTDEDAAAGFEALLVGSDLAYLETSREVPQVIRDLVNRMELIRFTEAKETRRVNILRLIDEAAAIVDQQG